MKTGFPARRKKFPKLEAIGTPFLGRKTIVASTSNTDLTTTINAYGEVPAKYIDKLHIQTIPDLDTPSLTTSVKLNIVDRTPTSNYAKTLTFFVPTDVASTTASNTPRNFTLNPGGNMVLSPGTKLQVIASNSELLAVPVVTGAVVDNFAAAKAGMPVANDIPVTISSTTTVVLTVAASTLQGDTNTYAGKLIRVIYDATTAGLVNQVRRIVSNAASGGYVTTITVDTAFVFGGANLANSAVCEIVGGDAWVSGVVLSDTTRQCIMGSAVAASGYDNMCLQILGWHVTGLNDTAAADASNVRLYFTDRTDEGTGTPANGNLRRTVTRWFMAKDTTRLETAVTGTTDGSTTATSCHDTGNFTPSALVGYTLTYTSGTAAGQSRVITANDADTLTTAAFSPAPSATGETYSVSRDLQSRGYINEGVNDCTIVGPPGYGLAAVGSSTGFTGCFSVIVWGRWVTADRHNQYNPHGIPHCGYEAFATTTGSVTQILPTMRGTADSAGTTTTIVDSTMVYAAGPPQTGWKEGCYVGAKISIVDGDAAGYTGTITAVDTSAGEITFTPESPTATASGSVYVISGFGGEDFWFCFDTEDDDHGSTAMTFGDHQGLFAHDIATEWVADTGALLVAGQTKYRDDIIVEGVVMNGHSAATPRLINLINGAATNAWMALAGQANTQAKMVLDGTSIRISPESVNAGLGCRTGIGVANPFITGNWDAVTVTLWGRRIPSKDVGSRNTVASGILQTNRMPFIMGS